MVGDFVISEIHNGMS